MLSHCWAKIYAKLSNSLSNPRIKSREEQQFPTTNVSNHSIVVTTQLSHHTNIKLSRNTKSITLQRTIPHNN